MIRPTMPADAPELIDLTRATGVFKPHEIDALQEVLDDYLAHNHQHGHVAVTYEEEGPHSRLRLLRPRRHDRPHLVSVLDRRASRPPCPRRRQRTASPRRGGHPRAGLAGSCSSRPVSLPQYDKTRRFY